MKSRNLPESFNNAINGIIYTLKYERNMKIHIATAFAVLVLGLFFKLSKLEFLIICMTIAVVIICELFNTAIEMLMDIIVDVYHPKAKIVKDISAGAVLVSAFVALIVGYIIFFDKMGIELDTGIRMLRHYPWHLTVIALLLVILLVLIFKAIFKKGTPFHGGMPSGHSAAAFSVTTAIAMWTSDARITLLCLFLSFLLIQSRFESKIHSIFELFAGALLGFLVTLLLFQVFHI